MKKVILLFIVLAVFITTVGCTVLAQGADNQEKITESVIASEKTFGEYVDPYAHVRFGEARNTLLLDVEWHTPETYREEVVDVYKKIADIIKMPDDEYMALPDDEKNSMFGVSSIAEYRNYYMNMSAAEKRNHDKMIKQTIEYYEASLNLIKENINYPSRAINGKTGTWYLNFFPANDELDPEGYYIFEVYPYFAYVVYDAFE